MEPLQKRFGRNVRALREARGWTQEQLGRTARLDPKHIGVIERGQKTSSFDAVAKLAAALRVDPHQLFFSDSNDTSMAVRLAKPRPPFRSLPKRKLEQLLTEIYHELRRAAADVE